MSIEDLYSSIIDQRARLAVIGLGYVGLPVACMFAQQGFDVLGVEIKFDRVAMINAGKTPIDGFEPGLAELLGQVVGNKKMRATSDYADLADRDVILIDVETPIDDNNVPRYEALRTAVDQLGPVLKKNALVIVESTISPGTMRSVVCPILEKKSGYQLNRDFFLGNCPERVMPGKLLANLKNLSRVVGGGSPRTADAMIALYKQIVHADLDPVDWVTAEVVKTVENAYRDVQIAFANEVALICESVGADVWTVRELVNKSPQRSVHLPGAGVGGHCIPKDSWLLVNGVAEEDLPIRLLPAARQVNDFMPHHMAELVKKTLAKAGRPIQSAQVLVMGYSYLENSDDTRNSPSEAMVGRLIKMGAKVVIHDPIVPEHQGDLMEKARGCDAAVVMVKHSAYLSLDLRALKDALRSPILVDGRRVYDGKLASDLGFMYVCIGSGK